MNLKELKGKKVMCIKMDGETSVKYGDFGIIQSIDDIGQIHTKWENGSSLALIPGVDQYLILTIKRERELKLKKLNEN